MRNLIVLGCSALLAVALGVTSYAGTAVDTDLDGVLDPVDNCDIDTNGPAAGPCFAQEDVDGDGFGNACDADVNGDLAVSILDVSLVLAESKVAPPQNLAMDFNCDTAVSIADVASALADSKNPLRQVPGPSCDHPVGVPCP